ncbi:MAG: rod shape-determining protein MreC [Candidatus Binataceae bacterium]
MKAFFVWRYRVVLTSGALLILSAHLLSIGVNPSGRLAMPAGFVMDAVRPIQIASARLADGATGLFRNYLDLVGVRRENSRLRAQLARLGAERTRAVELEAENRRLSELLDLKEALGLGAVAADVIGSDASGLSRTLIVAQGSEAGLKPGMAVLSGEGVVGKIIAVSHYAARVLLIDDHNSALDAFDQRSRARGIIAGVVDDGLTMKYVDRADDIKEGDVAVTSGLDGIFPRGLLVGHVSGVRREGPGLFLTVEIKPAVDFRRLEQVLVVTQQPPRVGDQAQG